jgi:hypothetical protein
MFNHSFRIHFFFGHNVHRFRFAHPFWRGLFIFSGGPPAQKVVRLFGRHQRLKKDFQPAQARRRDRRASARPKDFGIDNRNNLTKKRTVQPEVFNRLSTKLQQRPIVG